VTFENLVIAGRRRTGPSDARIDVARYVQGVEFR
jgi:hypothetical protein